MHRVILSSIALALSCPTWANETFNKQVEIQYSETGQSDTFIVAGQYFFEYVDTQKGPLNEALFLDPKSSVSVSYADANSDFGPGLSVPQSDTWRLGGQYVTQDQRYFFRLGVSLFDNEISNRFNGTIQSNDDEAEVYDLSAGMYLTNDWTVELSTLFIDDKIFDLEAYTLSSKKLFNLNDGTFVSVFGRATVVENYDDSFNLGAEYYFNRDLSISASHTWGVHIDDLKRGFTSISVNWFITPKIKLNAGFNVAAQGGLLNNIRDDIHENFSLGVVGRF